MIDEPLNEYLWSRLMLALYRSGRQAEALDAYAESRGQLVAQLGIEPGAGLKDLQRRILAGDPALLDEPQPQEQSPSAIAVPTPRQLPADVQDFVGRDRERAALLRLLSSSDRRRAVPVVTISGAPGVGKTALALHLGHRVVRSFPSGQLFLSLAGTSPHPRAPCDVLGEALRALGVPGARIPQSLADRAGLFAVCWWCWTTPPPLSRCIRCCPGPPAVPSSSPAGPS